MENDIILQEVSDVDGMLNIIDSQLAVINNVIDMDNGIYDELYVQKVKAMSNAMKLIIKVQVALTKEIG